MAIRGNRRSAVRPEAEAGGSGLVTAPEIDVTVVIPFFNPGPRLRETVEQTVQVLEASGASFEVVAVSDGSTDGSESTICDVASEEIVQRIVLPTNGGKGGALREGMTRGRGRYLGFIDGDGDLPPELLADFLEIARARKPDIIIGSKRHPDSEVFYPRSRRLLSWGYQKLVRLLFDLDVHDTQAGIKLVRRQVLEDVLPLTVERGYAFDLELLVAASRAGYTGLVEAPVRIRKRFSSTISIGAVVAMLFDTVAIFWRLKVKHAYDPPSF